MQTILIIIISCLVFGEISKCSVNAAPLHSQQLVAQVMTNLSNLEAAIRNAEPAIREYRDNIVYRGADHKLTTDELADLLITVRFVWHIGSRDTIVLMQHARAESIKKSPGDLTRWLGYCITLLRAINALIGTDDSIFAEGIMDTKKFVATINSFSEDFKGVRERITREVQREPQTFSDPAIREIQTKLDGIYSKYTEFLNSGFFA